MMSGSSDLKLVADSDLLEEFAFHESWIFIGKVLDYCERCCYLEFYHSRCDDCVACS